MIQSGLKLEGSSGELRELALLMKLYTTCPHLSTFAHIGSGLSSLCYKIIESAKVGKTGVISQWEGLPIGGASERISRGKEEGERGSVLNNPGC